VARFIPDIHSERWVVVAPGRVSRPDQSKKEDQVCVFCPGNEAMTPPEVFRVGEGEPNKPGWKIRVVPNKYPITDVHEVIIHSTDDDKNVNDLDDDQVNLIFQTYKQRFNIHKADGQIMIFCNQGFSAGASLAHPHSQLVVIPNQIKLDTLHRETIKNLIEENEHFVTYCPDFSQWPYEVWVAPKRSNIGTFGDSSDEELLDLSKIVKGVLKKLVKKFPELTYNYYIHHGNDWYLRIIPRLVNRAGFELGTGLQVNIIDPVQAASELMGE
jgi:UDPglucose--hexose-1-phosphate uridylyltransferase